MSFIIHSSARCYDISASPITSLFILKIVVYSCQVHEQVLNLVALHRPAECPGLFNALEAELFAPWEVRTNKEMPKF